MKRQLFNEKTVIIILFIDDAIRFRQLEPVEPDARRRSKI